MTAIAFPLPALPAQAFRRSWIVEQCRNAAAGQTFRKLLWQLVPATKATARSWNWQEIFQAVASEVGERFPIYEPDPALLEYGEATLDDYLDWGIPVAPFGNTADLGGCALELTNVTVYPIILEEPGECHTLRQDGLLPWLGTWWAGPAVDKHGQWLRPWRLPRGRKLTGVWVGVPDLIRWVRMDTGNMWLDTHPDDLDGSYGPRWSIGEINALTRLWQQAEPIHNRARALLQYVDARPNDRLQLLYRVLRGEPQALAQVTAPKVTRTLVDVFLGKEKH